jgi:hypothetical protein
MSDGSRRLISRLRIGDRVLVFDKNGIISSPILAILTHLHAPTIDFIDLYTPDTSLRLTPTHFLLVRKHNQRRDTYARAQDVSVGDFVFLSSSSNITPVRITRVERRTIENEDAYTPLTLEGTIIAVIGYSVNYLGLLVLLLKNLHVLKYKFVLQVYYLDWKSVLQYRYLGLIYESTSTFSTKCT